MNNQTERTCGLPSCGKPFAGLGKRKYCSETCAKAMIKIQLETLRVRRLKAAQEKREEERTCSVCNAKFTPTNKFAPLSSLRYCSVACKKEGQERVLDRYRKKPRDLPTATQSTPPQPSVDVPESL